MDQQRPVLCEVQEQYVFRIEKQQSGGIQAVVGWSLVPLGVHMHCLAVWRSVYSICPFCLNLVNTVENFIRSKILCILKRAEGLSGVYGLFFPGM